MSGFDDEPSAIGDASPSVSSKAFWELNIEDGDHVTVKNDPCAPSCRWLIGLAGEAHEQSRARLAADRHHRVDEFDTAPSIDEYLMSCTPDAR